MAFLGNLKNNLVNTVNSFTHSSSPAPITKAQVLGLEETERTRRINQASQSHVDIQNAANVSGLIKGETFPIFKGNVSKGYKRVTTKYEEEERRRRLTNRSECALRRANANKSARMIQQLGWPFWRQNHSGAEFFVMDPAKLLEEDERQWRLSAQYWGAHAKHNAAMVANILRWANFQKNSKAGFARHLVFLSEKERQERLTTEAMNNSMEHSYNEAALIKGMGAPFYVQESEFSKRDFSSTHKLEEHERLRRMESSQEKQLAHELAGLVQPSLPKKTAASAVSAPVAISSPGVRPIFKDISLSRAFNTSGNNLNKDLEEQERGNRISDVKQQKLAMSNAKNVSLMVRESSMNKIDSTAPMWFSISRNSMRALEEIERTRRLRDIEGQRFARTQAKLVADLFTNRELAPAKPDFHGIVEQERQARMLDRQGQQLAQKNARKVSGLIARHNLMSNSSLPYFKALEEGERSRRLQDREFQDIARNNARKISNLVSSLNVAPGNLNRQATESLPTFTAPISPAPVAVSIPAQAAPISSTPIQSMPVAPIQAPVISPLVASAPISSLPTYQPTSSIAPIQSAPLVSAPISAAPISVAPISAPIQKSVAPISSAPLSAAPVQSAPLQKFVAPLQAAPLQAAPIQRSVAPTYSAPIQSAPLSYAPMSAPTNNSIVYSQPVQPIVLSATSVPVPVAPLNSVIRTPSYTSIPTATPTVVPADPHLNVFPGALGERERRNLMKQADKQNRKSDRDIRKAEKSMLKAEKMHQKGRDDKAIKLESKAETFMKNAEHKRQFANGIQNTVSYAPAPASM